MSNLSMQRGHRGILLAISAASVMMALAIAAAYAADDEEPNRTMIVTALEDAKFAPLDLRRPEAAQMAVLGGDPNTGPSATLLRLNKGVGRMHVHTADYHLVVLEGTMQHWAQGPSQEKAKQLGPGAFWFQPGEAPHTDACLSEQCLMYVQWAGKRDGRLAEAAR